MSATPPISPEAATRLGRELASQLGYDLAALDSAGVDFVRFGTACNAAFNAWGGRTKLPIELLVSSPSPHTPTAGTAGATVAPALPPGEPRRHIGRARSRWARLGASVVRTRAFRVLASATTVWLGVLSFGWLPVLAVVSMGFAPAGAVFVLRRSVVTEGEVRQP